MAIQLDNKDYDGDEVNFMPAMDHVMEDLYYPFRPHFNLLLLDKPLELSRNASMTDSIVASTSEWITQSRRMAAAKHR